MKPSERIIGRANELYRTANMSWNDCQLQATREYLDEMHAAGEGKPSDRVKDKIKNFVGHGVAHLEARVQAIEQVMDEQTGDRLAEIKRLKEVDEGKKPLIDFIETMHSELIPLSSNKFNLKLMVAEIKRLKGVEAKYNKLKEAFCSIYSKEPGQ